MQKTKLIINTDGLTAAETKFYRKKILIEKRFAAAGINLLPVQHYVKVKFKVALRYV
ncbi:hypothetical protein [Ferruginibacter sp.]